MFQTNSDKKWQSYNKELEALIKTGEFFQIGTLYYEMANFLDKENKDSSQLRKLGYNMKLKVNKQNLKECIKSDVVAGVEIVATETSCEFCKKLDGKIFLKKDVLLANPLPVEHCTYICGCRCVYAPVL